MPRFICAAATASLNRGETFFTRQKHLPDLRQALAANLKRHFNRTMAADRFIVTGSSMLIIQLAIQEVAGAGTEVLLPTPA